jgi:mannose-1-phosphate guanylyltransferase
VNVSVIMAGGGGTRLWPASVKSRPKQLLAFAGDSSLLAATARRMTAFADETLVVTTGALVDEVARALPDLPAANLLAEPAGRNTAAALGLAAVVAEERHPGCVLGCVPADQHIASEPIFARTVRAAGKIAASRDAIVTIGIWPTRAETGFGYLEIGEAPEEGLEVRVERFVEKPDAATAASYLADRRHLWNAGMFFVSARKLLGEIRTHLPALAAGLDELRHALPRGDAAFSAALARIYPTLPSISIDHGVMEKATDVVTIEGHFGWNDVGAWSALPEVLPADAAGTHTGGGARLVSEDASGNVVYGDPGTVVALLGVEDLVVVRAGHRVLVMPRARAQELKTLTARLDPEDL